MREIVKPEAVRIGSRGSALALWQARWVRGHLGASFPDRAFDIVIIKTKGDRILDAPLSKIGDKGLFTREIEHALLDGTIDLAVHSLKDLPTELPEGLTIGAVSEREDVRDVFLPRPGNAVHTLLGQPAGAEIATGSLRRKCQILNLRPDVRIVDIRGNLNTRLTKLEQSAWAGMMLARAGVVRLGWEDRIGEALDPLTILPAVGQGALAVEIRTGDEVTRQLIAGLHHPWTGHATEAERALLRRLEGGCQVPIGTYGRVVESSGVHRLLLDAIVGSLDGRTVVRGAVEGEPGEAALLGSRLAELLLERGAGAILADIRRVPGRADGP
jgi:hydroxymethylbilane synthase